jgi:DNA-binding HxlR family transcriptional regulator
MGLMTEPGGYAGGMLGKDYQGQDCSLARSLEVVGERWTLLIVRDAFYGVRRFNDFQAHLDIPKAVLSGRLNGLVEHGILERRPDPHHAGRHVYELTAAGRDLWPALHALLAWGDRHRYPNSRVFTHAACGTRLDASGVCATCGLTPGPDGIVMKPRRGRGTLRDDPVTAALRAPHRLLEPVET